MEPLLGDSARHGNYEQGAGGEATVFVLRNGVLIPATAEEAADAQNHVKSFRGTSCGLRPNNCVRASAIHIVSTRAFNHLILAVILFNCMYMLFEPSRIAPGSREASRSALVEWVSMAVFTAEVSSRRSRPIIL